MCWVSWRSGTFKVDHWAVLILSFLSKAPRIVWWWLWEIYVSTCRVLSKFAGYRFWDFPFQGATDFEVSNKGLQWLFLWKDSKKTFAAGACDVFVAVTYVNFLATKTVFPEDFLFNISVKSFGYRWELVKFCFIYVDGRAVLFLQFCFRAALCFLVFWGVKFQQFVLKEGKKVRSRVVLSQRSIDRTNLICLFSFDVMLKNRPF